MLDFRRFLEFGLNLRLGVLFSEERERKATRDTAVSQALVRREETTTPLALLYFRAPPKKITPDRRLVRSSILSSGAERGLISRTAAGYRAYRLASEKSAPGSERRKAPHRFISRRFLFVRATDQAGKVVLI